MEADPYLQYFPSKIAAAAIAVARLVFGMTLWTRELEKQTGYTLEELKDIIMHLCRSHAAAANLQQQAIQEKFKANK